MKRLLLAASLAIIAGCGTPAKLNYYTLGVNPTTTLASTAPRHLNIYLGPVTIPESVDRPQMVRRLAGNEVEITDLERWAEPLKAAIPRLISASLSRSLGTAMVMTSRQSATLTFDYRVAIDVQRFEFSADEGAHIELLWTIRTAKDGPPRTGRGEARERAAGGDAQSMAAALSIALERLAGEISFAIESIERP